jgi:single-stranded DNA-binding protein
MQRLEENLERGRRVGLEVQRRVEQLEQEGNERSKIQQQAEKAAHNLQQLTETGKGTRGAPGSSTVSRAAGGRTETSATGAQPLEEGAGRSEARPWWRRPVLVVGLLFGALAA